MGKTFLGEGLSFPFKLESDGSIAQAAYDESVRQSLWIILSTSQGERVMRPDFGCGIYDFVFEVNSASTSGKVVHAVREALVMQEPRIDVRSVYVEAHGDGETLLIHIEYEVRATNNVFNLVYPFYLVSS